MNVYSICTYILQFSNKGSLLVHSLHGYDIEKLHSFTPVCYILILPYRRFRTSYLLFTKELLHSDSYIVISFNTWFAV